MFWSLYKAKIYYILLAIVSRIYIICDNYRKVLLKKLNRKNIIGTN